MQESTYYNLPYNSDESVSMKAQLIPSSISVASSLKDLVFEVNFQIQGKPSKEWCIGKESKLKR